MLHSVATKLTGLPATTRDRLAVWSVLALLAVDYAVAHQYHQAHPRTLGFTGWWLWGDQGRYMRAIQAWAHGVLDPTQHWYFPGYPLLGAAFDRLTPIQPLYFPDLLCLVAFAWLLIQLAERLAPTTPWIRPLAALTILVTVALSPLEMKAFVEPWTTTPTAPISVGALLLAIRFWDRATAWGAALTGLVAASILLFRPTEAIIIVVAAGSFAGLALLRQRMRPGRAVALIACGAAGAAVPILAALGLHDLLYGWTLSQYELESQSVGFEWRLIPLHWVMLFVSPKPLIGDEAGLLQVFPWIVPGIAGMAACLVATRGTVRARHLLVIGTVALHCTVFLAYRDLHPQGLIRYGNYHYFKWVLPIFGLYGVFLVAVVVAAPWRLAAWGAGALAVVALFCWRAEWLVPAPGYAAGDARIEPPRTLVLQHGLHSVLDAVRVEAAGGWPEIYHSGFQMKAGDATYSGNADIKSFPVPGGLLFTTLRPTAPGMAVVTFDPGVTLLPGSTPQIGRMNLVFGWPGLFLRARERLDHWWQGGKKRRAAS